MKRNLVIVFALLCLPALHAKDHDHPWIGEPAIYVVPTNGFEVNIAAAFQRKNVGAHIVMNEEAADYVLRPAEVVIHKESGAGKIARCMFAYCAGIEDSGDVSVQLIEKQSQRIVWAYQVTKQRGARNRQSMAEAIAKHLEKEFLKQGW